MSHERSSSLSTTFSSNLNKIVILTLLSFQLSQNFLTTLLPLSEVTLLSLVFMTIIGYKLYIDNEEYKIYENYIIGDYLENYFCYNNTSLH